MTFMKEFQHLKIPLKVLESTTNNFAETKCIGRSGFGKVYKGEILLSGVLTMVAVKRLDTLFGQGTVEFWKEIMILIQYKHDNIVSLLGFCDEGGENLLVYEYLSNKSLDLYLNNVDLSWHQRLFICLEAAMGLQYLHEPVGGSRQRVLHRDIKSANILLDHNWKPKIADFGLSKLGPANQQFTFLISNAVGTIGYIDPLYAHNGFLTKESDVYSFGVVLFEVLCGRPCVLQHHNDIHRYLAALSRKCYEEKKMDTIIHIGLHDNISPKCLERFSAIAYQCLQLDHEERPTMGRVVQELRNALRYQADFVDSTEPPYFPPLQIVMLIVGTLGDVQPFVAIGKRLQKYGHRVRLATHPNLKEFVLTAGLEFYPLGGDPKVLAEYMVKNKGFLPSGPSEIFVQRSQVKEIIYSLLPACKDPDLDTGIPLKAEAIIANPPAYEALKIPIHIFFTMPWTATSEFPHPLSRVKQPSGYRTSYQTVDSFIWLGIRDIINDLRKKKLKLRPVYYLDGYQGSEANIPRGYMWSPHLVNKPEDWGPKSDVVGYCFLDLASNYEPPEELIRWLKAGPKRIYVGFGSLPVQEPEKMTEIIVTALEETGQRGIINKGPGGLGNFAKPKDYIYSLDNIPHDWLFSKCASVVHHGGAGTTAAGLKAACPTTVVPFFGDQQLWGERIHARGVGPSPIPIHEFTFPKLIDAINFMLNPKVKKRAMELAKAMENEDGAGAAVEAFLRHLPRNGFDTDPRPTSSSGWTGNWKRFMSYV